MTEPNKTAAASAADDFLTLRDGEVTVAPPAQFDASIYFIGRIRTPWQRRFLRKSCSFVFVTT